MTQRDRDRLVALKKAKKGLITQREGAAEIGQSERHIRRLLLKLRADGDAAVDAEEFFQHGAVDHRRGKLFQSFQSDGNLLQPFSLPGHERSLPPFNTFGHSCDRSLLF